MSATDPSDPRTVRLAPRSSARITRRPLPSPASGEDTDGAVRFDTDDCALRRRDLTLSRIDGAAPGWLLSIPQGDDHWAVEVPALRSAPQRMPAALAQLLDGIVGEAELAPIDDDGAPSKHTKKASKKKSSAGAPSGADVLQAVLAQQASALELWDLKARLDLPDALHQLRVTARSLRGLLKSARPFLDREAADELGDLLQQLGRSLSEARDAEAMAELLPDRAAALRGRVSDRTREVLTTTARKHAEDLAEKTRRSASHPERLAAISAARAAADQPPFADKGLRKAEKLDAQQMSDRLVQRGLRKASKEVQRALDADEQLSEQHRFEHLHTVRKATKRVRYVTKVLKASGFRPAEDVRQLGKAAKRAQDALGETMDASVTAAWLDDSSARLRRAGADPFELGLLTGAELQRVAGGLDDGFRVIERLSQKIQQHAD